MKKSILQLILLIITIISTFLVFFNLIYISLITSFIILFISLFTLKKNKRILFFIITISLSTITTNVLIINNKQKESIDIYEKMNILEGTWQYNDFGGTYIFNNDFTYTNYIFDTNDNYCKGTYEYKYGGIGKNGTIIKEDKNFYYYNLNLKEEYCIINNQKTNTENNNEFIFSIGKNNNKKLLINKNTDELFILHKK